MDYDALGNVTHAKSLSTPQTFYTEFNYIYDPLNRATQAVCRLDNIPGFATVQYKIDYQFDPVGNVTNRTITGSQGFTDTIETRYQYDAMNRLTNVVQLTNNAATANAWYRYDSAGRLSQKGYGNGDVVTQGYDIESRLLTLGITNDTTPVQWYDYLWDAGGNILAITNLGGASSASTNLYAYDAAGQLTNEMTATMTNAWVYDEAGNWITSPGEGKWRLYNADNEMVGVSGNSAIATTVTGTVDHGPNNNKWYNTWAECRGVSARISTNDGTFSIANVPLYPGQNNLAVTVTDVSGNAYQTNRTVTKNVTEGFGYDGNGNLVTWTNGSQNWSYEWDWADRLTKVSSNSIVLFQNWYDAQSRRIAKSEVVNGQTNKWLYLYDGWNIIGVMNENGQILETFTRGIGLAGDIGTLVAVTHHSGANAGTYYTHHNHRGDVVATRSGTTTVGSYFYSAFGLQTSALGDDLCRFKFSSKERDASTGFSYYGYRFYAPTWQRWVNSDPIEERGGVNLYNYVANNTVRLIDPLGLDRQSCFDGCWSDALLKVTKASGNEAVCQMGSQIVGGVFIAGGLYFASRQALIPAIICTGIGGVCDVMGPKAAADNLEAEKSRIREKYQECILKCQKDWPNGEPKACDFMRDHPLK